MEDNLTLEAWYEALTAREAELLRRGLRTLISRTFIIKSKERELFGFFTRNTPHINEYVGMMGYMLFVEPDAGIIMLRDRQAEKVESKEIAAVNKKRFTVKESIVYCTLAFIFLDRMESGVDRSVLIHTDDLKKALEQFGINIGFKTDFNKTELRSIFKTLGRFSLISVKGEIGDPDCVIELFPTLLFGMDLKSAEEFLKSKKDSYVRGAAENAEEEENEEDETGEAEDGDSF